MLHGESLGKARYQEYLHGPFWRARKVRYLRENGVERCEARSCGSPGPLQVHHESYARLFGAELDRDLEALCGRCHMEAGGY